MWIKTGDTLRNLNKYVNIYVDGYYDGDDSHYEEFGVEQDGYGIFGWNFGWNSGVCLLRFHNYEDAKEYLDKIVQTMQKSGEIVD